MKTHHHTIPWLAVLMALVSIGSRGQGVRLYVVDRDIACQASRRVKS